MKEYNIAAIAGDGIGKEVVPEGLKILKEAALKHQFKINFTEYDFASCDYYKKHGKMLPDDWREKLSKHNAIFLVQLVCLIRFLIIFHYGDHYSNLEEDLINT